MDLVHVISEYINQHYGSANGIGEQLKYNYNDMRVIDLNEKSNPPAMLGRME